MTAVFVVSSAVAIVATALVVTKADAVHALMYLVVSFLAVAVDFWVLGAPLVAALEIILYAGAILVLFVFVVMLVDEGPAGVARERERIGLSRWIGPGVLTLVLLAEMGWIAVSGVGPDLPARAVDSREVAVALYGPYVLAVEAASFLLLAGLVGAWHLARQDAGVAP